MIPITEEQKVSLRSELLDKTTCLQSEMTRTISIEELTEMFARNIADEFELIPEHFDITVEERQRVEKDADKFYIISTKQTSTKSIPLNKKIRNIAIYGSTGSIGRQSLDVLDRMENNRISVLSAGSQWELLVSQALKYLPQSVVIGDVALYSEVKEALFSKSIRVLVGEEGLEVSAQNNDYDFCINGLVGTSGLLPSYHCLTRGIDLALANKESLVIGGQLLLRLSSELGGNIIPIDSEHSAIMQCLMGESHSSISNLILTASGGPFREWDIENIRRATPEQALNHPTWKMGNRITIDSATLMNKGMEVIEACYLFDVDVENVKVLIHPQSIIHSMVEFVDGSFKAQMGTPDMRLPILLSLTYPDRVPIRTYNDNPLNWGSLEFSPVDNDKFPCLQLAKKAFAMGGTAGAVLNSADEVAVSAFLNNRITFTDIPKVINFCLECAEYCEADSLANILDVDRKVRILADEYIDAISNAKDA